MPLNGVVVCNAAAACERFEKLGVPFQKKPDGGSMKVTACHVIAD